MKEASEFPAEFTIEFLKLKDGTHTFQYEIEKPFFEAFGNSEVLSSNVKGHLILDKQNQMLQLDIDLKGTVGLSCDRCLENLNMLVDTQYKLIYKFRDEERSDPMGEYEMVYISPQETTIVVAQQIYESILLNLPMLRNCDEMEVKPCNNEMLQKLDELKQNGEVDTDPRWDKLKDLLK